MQIDLWEGWSINEDDSRADPLLWHSHPEGVTYKNSGKSWFTRGCTLSVEGDCWHCHAVPPKEILDLFRLIYLKKPPRWNHRTGSRYKDTDGI